MRSIQLPLLLFAALFAFLLASCGQAAPPDQPDATPVAVVTLETPPTAVPTATVTPSPTAVPTEAPTNTPTATPEPTFTPTATPEPAPPTVQPLTDPLPQASLAVRLTPVAQGFVAPTAMAAPDDGSGRLFVADQTGLIYVVTIRPRVLDEPFLDIRNRLVELKLEGDGRGLLGLALHPNYAENGRFFVHYSAPLREEGPEGWDHTSHIAEFRALRPSSDRADAASERIIMQIDQPQAVHNGGQIAFGPDGYLYISLGDGGVPDNGLDATTLLGSVLRIDVDSEEAPYAIPADNPLVGYDGRNEIFAYGFRNPAHFAFAADGRLLVAESGQPLWQEINLVAAGGNYSWPLPEQCAQLSAPAADDLLPVSAASLNCGDADDPALQPVMMYGPDGLGARVVGGFVYQGRVMPSFRDHYLFGDWGQGATGGRLFIAPPQPEDPSGWQAQELLVLDGENGRLTDYLRAVAYDAPGEIYLLTSEQTDLTGRTGKLYRIGPQIAAQPRLVENAQEYLPLTQQYARILDLVPIYRTLEDVAADEPFGTHGEGHTWVTAYEEREVNGRRYRRVHWDWGAYAWVESSALHFTSPMSRLQGLELEPGDLTGQQMAMAHRPVWVRSEPGVVENETIAGYLEPWDLVTVYEETTVDDNIWYRIGPDQWVHWDFIRLFYERERPEEIEAGEKWIHISLSQQTVIAYEGDTPVYASLTATGRRAYPTFPGLFRVYAKLRVGPMRWENAVPPYNLANVPWIMYFNQDQALHGSYWHDLFGTVRSAGCVNLSPYDAHWFFHWAEPYFEPGGRIVYSSEEEPGTWVFVEN
jgi:glucose/arabinose dehydrogenase/lipoprotein-anchoring transpeptidase ErfK/SrfK